MFPHSESDAERPLKKEAEPMSVNSERRHLQDAGLDGGLDAEFSAPEERKEKERKKSGKIGGSLTKAWY